MRPSSLILLVAVAAGCNVRVPRGLGLPIAATATVRASVEVKAPEPVVAIQGAAVPEFFGIPLDGAQDIVFALDVSGSMGDPASGRAAQIAIAPPTTPPAPPPPGAPPPPAVVPKKIEVAKAELVEALQRLPAGTRVDVVFFDHDVGAFAADLVALDDATRANLIAYVGASDAEGSTALAPAMRAAFVMNAKRVVLLSDGLGNVGGGADAVLRDAREAISGGVRIDTVGLGTGQDAALLSTLANESGGLYQAL
jgi:Mg-chelatase subunit ChlD